MHLLLEKKIPVETCYMNSFQMLRKNALKIGYKTDFCLQKKQFCNVIIFSFFQFVAHPNVQQLLASIWYEGLPGFRQMNMILQGLEVVRIGLLFPFFSMAYIICPWIGFSQKLRKPFIKFICTSASYFTFLCKALFHTFLSKNSTLQKTKMKFLLKLSFCTKI